MKFLIDAQLPRRVAAWMTQAGHDALHTLDMPLKNRTPDAAIVSRALQDGRVVITKDDDFVQAFLINGQPPLLLISTGNITNDAPERLMRANLADIEAAFVAHRFVEITRDAMVIRE